MRRFDLLPYLLFFCCVTAGQAQTTAPKPDPELKKLHVLVGHWTYEGEYKPGPLGPGGKVTGKYVGEMILGGFFFRGDWTENGPAGQTEGFEIKSYDPVNKRFAGTVYQNDGSVWSGILTVSGNTEIWTGKIVAGGTQYLIRATSVFSADSMSVTQKGEVSTDGSTWAPCWEEKYTKIKPAVKK